MLGEEMGGMVMRRGRRGMDPQGDRVAKRRRRGVGVEVVKRVGRRERGRGVQGGRRVVRVSVVELLLLLLELLLVPVGGTPSRLGRGERHINSK